MPGTPGQRGPTPGDRMRSYDRRRAAYREPRAGALNCREPSGRAGHRGPASDRSEPAGATGLKERRDRRDRSEAGRSAGRRAKSWRGGGGTKSSADPAVADQLLAKIDEINKIFWETKQG